MFQLGLASGARTGQVGFVSNYDNPAGFPLFLRVATYISILKQGQTVYRSEVLERKVSRRTYDTLTIAQKNTQTEKITGKERQSAI